MRCNWAAMQLSLQRKKSEILKLIADGNIDTAVLVVGADGAGVALAKQLRVAVQKMVVLADKAHELFAPGCAFPAADAYLPLPLDEKELLARVGQLMALPSTQCEDRPAISRFRGLPARSGRPYIRRCPRAGSAPDTLGVCSPDLRSFAIPSGSCRETNCVAHSPETAWNRLNGVSMCLSAGCAARSSRMQRHRDRSLPCWVPVTSSPCDRMWSRKAQGRCRPRTRKIERPGRRPTMRCSAIRLLRSCRAGALPCHPASWKSAS